MYANYLLPYLHEIYALQKRKTRFEAQWIKAANSVLKKRRENANREKIKEAVPGILSQ